MERKKKHENILILGAGSFGTCLAQHLATLGYKLQLYARSTSLAESINEKNLNFRYFPHEPLHPSIKAISTLTQKALESSSLVILAIPTQSMREALEPIKHHLKSKLLLCVSKGIEVDTLQLPSDILFSLLGESAKENAVYLSGPSFAVEIMQKQPTAVTVASYNKEYAKVVQKIFHTPYFRVYLSEDPVGVEIAGALKNVIAIAAGACTGLGFKANSLAALITRGLSELSRIGLAMGANSLTFIGLAGIGDLMLTCSSQKSRNFRVGYLLASKKTLEEAKQELGSVAEGIATAKAAYILAEKLGVRVSIVTAVYRVLYENCDLREAVNDLLTGSAKSELE